MSALDVIIHHRIETGHASHWEWRCVGCETATVIQPHEGASPEYMDFITYAAGADHIARMLKEAKFLITEKELDAAKQDAYIDGYTDKVKGVTYMLDGHRK